MKRIHLIIISSVLALLFAGLSIAWFVGSFYINKAVKDSPLLNIEKFTITGFPLSYKMNIENATILGKQTDKLILKKVEVDLNLLKKSLHIKNTDDIIVSTTLNNQEISKYHRCEEPTTTDFSYKNYFWYTSSKPKIEKIIYNNKKCKVVDQDNQELLRVDESTIRLGVQANNILFSINARGFKDYLSKSIKIGDFKLDVKGEFIKSVVSNSNEEETQLNILIVVDGEKIESAKIEANLESDLTINGHLIASYKEGGYEVNSEIKFLPIENIIDDIVLDYNLSKKVVSKMVELVSAKEGEATKFSIHFDSKKGVYIGSQDFNQLQKKYFYLQKLYQGFNLQQN